jgi:hypothetical protein
VPSLGSCKERWQSLSLSLIPLAFISEELRAKRKKELKKDNASRIKATVDEVCTV